MMRNHTPFLASLLCVLATPAAVAGDWGLLVNKTGLRMQVSPMVENGSPERHFVLTPTDVTGQHPLGESEASSKSLQVILKTEMILEPDQAIHIQLDKHMESNQLLPLRVSSLKKASIPFEFKVDYLCNKTGEQSRSFLTLDENSRKRNPLPFKVVSTDQNILTLLPF